MPKVREVLDRGELATALPLRITSRIGRTIVDGVKQPSIRVKCGCCSEAFVISYDAEPTKDPHLDTLEINGVYGTLDQWRQVLLPLLQMEQQED